MSFPLWTKFYEQFHEFLPLLPYHSYLCEQLFAGDIESSPNILLHGPLGFPHTVMVEYALAQKTNSTYPIHKRFPVWNQMTYVETDAYFEIDMAHPGFPQDIQTMIEFLVSIVRNKCILLSRHIMVLKNLDVLHHNNPQAFRVLLERFSGNVLFIATTHKINHLEAPILSRMLTFRVPLPTEEQNKAVLHKISGKKTIRIKDRNLLHNIFLNEPSVLRKIKTIPVLEYPPLQECMDRPLSTEELRKMAYRLFQQGISIRTMTLDLLSSIPSEIDKHAFLMEASSIEHIAAMSDPSKVCFFIEYILNIYNSYTYKEETTKLDSS